MPKNPTRKGFFFFLVEGWLVVTTPVLGQHCIRGVRKGGWDPLPSGSLLFPHRQKQPWCALPHSPEILRRL